MKRTMMSALVLPLTLTLSSPGLGQSLGDFTEDFYRQRIEQIRIEQKKSVWNTKTPKENFLFDLFSREHERFCPDLLGDDFRDCLEANRDKMKALALLNQSLDQRLTKRLSKAYQSLIDQAPAEDKRLVQRLIDEI